MILNEAQFAHVMSVLENPPPPNERLIEAHRRYMDFIQQNMAPSSVVRMIQTIINMSMEKDEPTAFDVLCAVYFTLHHLDCLEYWKMALKIYGEKPRIAIRVEEEAL